MIVKKVELHNFLSYTYSKAEFSSGVNIITGANASGKTNLIDSIYFASIGKSSRHSKDKELINWESQAGAKVTVQVEKKFSSHTVEIFIDQLGKKRITVDRLPIQRMGELMGVINVVFFSPEELKLVKETPQDRRRFLDISLSQQSKAYFYNLQKYNKLLQQRNKLLKEYKGRPSLDNMLKIVDTDLIKSGAFLFQERKVFIERLNLLAKEEHSRLTSGEEELRLVYETESIDFERTEESFSRILEKSRDMDVRLEYTTSGPHRDDIKIVSNNVDIRKFGSQGQQRTAVLSLKLAEIGLFKERTGETPVLLLDDVLSELDESRRKALFDSLSGIQTLVTCTEFQESFFSDYKKFTISERKVHSK